MILPAAFPIRDAIALAVQIVNFPALRAPLSIFPKGADGQQNMGVGIASPFVVNGEVRTHPGIHKIAFDKGADKGQLLRW